MGPKQDAWGNSPGFCHEKYVIGLMEYTCVSDRRHQV